MGFFDTEKGVEEYLEMAKGHDGRELIEKLSEYLPANSTVLELGIGPGTDLELLSKRYEVTGSDNSNLFLERYRKVNPEADLILLDAVTLETDRRFDCIFSNKVLQHLQREELEESIPRQAEVLNEMAKDDFWSVALVGFNVTMAENQELLEAMRNAAGRGVGIIGMKALGGGQRGPDSPAEVPDSNKTAMLKWVLNHEEVTTIIPGVTTFDQLDLDWSVASDLAYSGEERRFLEQDNLLSSLQFCQQCQECLPSCPNDVDVPTLMRTYMYAAQYANFAHARMTLDGIPPRQGIAACSSCSACTAQCSHSIDIPRRVSTLKDMYVV